MGGCLTVNIPCDPVYKSISTRVSYIHNLSENVESLEQAMEALKAKGDDVKERVDREEFNGHRQRLSQVQVWLTSILTIEQQINVLLTKSKRKLQRLCLCGFCSKNIGLRCRYGKKVVMMMKEVESLTSQGEFDVVTRVTGIAEVEELPIEPTIVGHETMIAKVWNRLMEEKVGIVGLYGMGGVGKTTLLEQIHNEFSKKSGEFNHVIWVVVSNNAKVRNIQESIAKKLGLRGNEWDEKDENERALDIHKVLKRQKLKFVLMLDDIWEKVSLKAVGVPDPNIENGCKVAFTTRSRDVCGRMGVSDPIEVSCLNPENAWELFKKKIGENTLGSHPDIPELAKKVAEKCKGLPLALNVIGETMASRNTVQDWHRAIDDLKTYARKFLGVKDEILPILKYSYDNLKGEQLKSCFLYCSLFPEDYSIRKERLIEIWIGEGFIDETEGRKLGLNQGSEILGTLVRACLLLDKDEHVRMHDVVREMAIWIASDLEECKERYIVQAGVGLREVPKVKNGKNVRKMSLMENKIEKLSESLDCLELTTLLLQKNEELVTISGEFFQSTPKLLVLDLSFNSNLIGLPEQVSDLVFLRYLNLSSTSIEHLPVGLHKLKMLIHLDLEHMEKLESLHGISNLSSLRTLRLIYSGVFLDVSLMKELQLLEYLELLSVNMPPSLIEELLNTSPYPIVKRCIQQLLIKEISKGSVRILILPILDNLRQFTIIDCGMLEIKIEKTPWNKTPADLCFSNLYYVRIENCNDVKDLTWLLFAPNLENIVLWNLKKLEEIISKEKVASFLEDKTCNILPFQKLQLLRLSELPELKSIYWKALPFQCLKFLRIFGDCKKLKKLPVDSKSVNNVEEFVIECDDEEWIEWEDEATRQRFLPSLNR